MSHLCYFLSACAKAQNNSETLYKLTNTRQQSSPNARHTNSYTSWHYLPQVFVIGLNPNYARSIFLTFPRQILFITIYLSIIRGYITSEDTWTSLKRYEMEYDLGRKFWCVSVQYFEYKNIDFKYPWGFMRLYHCIFYEIE